MHRTEHTSCMQFAVSRLCSMQYEPVFIQLLQENQYGAKKPDKDHLFVLKVRGKSVKLIPNETISPIF